MTPRSGRQLDVSTASLCGGFVGMASGVAVLGVEARPPTMVVVALLVTAVAAASVAALIANAYARRPWPKENER